MAATAPTTAPVYTEEDYNDFAHTGPGTLAGRYMRMFWQPVARSEDIRAGRTRTLKIMNQEFTAYRGTSGKPYLLDFRCAHRGTQLSAGWVEDDCIRCVYHGWKYDGSGQCVEQPGEPESFANRIKIRSYPTEDYLGLVFAYLGEGEPPPLPRYPDWERIGVRGVRGHIRYVNYFQYIENHPDQIHVPFIHRSRWQYGRDWRIENFPAQTAEEFEWGMLNHAIEPDGRERRSAMCPPNVCETRGSNPGQQGLGVVLPQVPLNKLLSILWNVPIDDETSVEFVVYSAGSRGGGAPADWSEEHMLAESKYELELAMKVLDTDMTMEEADAISERDHFPGAHQDSVSQVGQARLVDRTNDHLGRSDVGVMLWRKLWRQELQALAEGRPLRQWVRPEWIYGTE